MENSVENSGKWIIRGIAGVIVLFLVAWLWPLASVGTNQTGVVTLYGNVKGTLSSGLHIINPLSGVTVISNQTRTIDDTGNSKLDASTDDLQDVKVESVTTYHIPATFSETVYSQYGTTENFESSKINPTVSEAIKAVVAQYSAEELITKRAEVSTKIETTISTNLQAIGVVAEDFKLTNIDFSDQYNAAIESKATAQQNAQTEKANLEKVQYQNQQALSQAQTQAETIKIQAEAINSQGGADYVELQAIQKWDGHLPDQMIPGQTLPFINITQSK